MISNNKFSIVKWITVLLVNGILCAQEAKPPIMGWSSWNNFRVHIDEKIIMEQADAMITSGLYEAGYRYINIDDGYLEEEIRQLIFILIVLNFHQG
jgi:hypothetical protein